MLYYNVKKQILRRHFDWKIQLLRTGLLGVSEIHITRVGKVKLGDIEFTYLGRED